MTGFFGKTYGKSRKSPPVDAPVNMRPLTQTEIYKRSVHTPHVAMQMLPGVKNAIVDTAQQFNGYSQGSLHIIPGQGSIPETVLVLSGVEG